MQIAMRQVKQSDSDEKKMLWNAIDTQTRFTIERLMTWNVFTSTSILCTSEAFCLYAHFHRYRASNTQKSTFSKGKERKTCYSLEIEREREKNRVKQTRREYRNQQRHRALCMVNPRRSAHKERKDTTLLRTNIKKWHSIFTKYDSFECCKYLLWMFDYFLLQLCEATIWMLTLNHIPLIAFILLPIFLWKCYYV